MTAQIYAPRMRPVPPPCAKDCPERGPGARARMQRTLLQLDAL